MSDDTKPAPSDLRPGLEAALRIAREQQRICGEMACSPRPRGGGPRWDDRAIEATVIHDAIAARLAALPEAPATHDREALAVLRADLSALDEWEAWKASGGGGQTTGSTPELYGLTKMPSVRQYLRRLVRDAADAFPAPVASRDAPSHVDDATTDTTMCGGCGQPSYVWSWEREGKCPPAGDCVWVRDGYDGQLLFHCVKENV